MLTFPQELKNMIKMYDPDDGDDDIGPPVWFPN